MTIDQAIREMSARVARETGKGTAGATYEDDGERVTVYDKSGKMVMFMPSKAFHALRGSKRQ